MVEDVPLFDAHEGDDGVPYDHRLLSIIAENNNRRIRDTGDWTPLVIGHTCDEDCTKDHDHDPPVVGFAGNYRVGMFGKERPRPCIFADFYVFRDCAAEFRSHPRRSVEVWPEERPEDRYFDPIALLGAETPRRDLGTIYSKPRGTTKRPIRYSMEASAASAPSGTNTTLPSTDIRKRKPVQNDKGSTMLSQEELDQIAEALRPTIQSMVAEATSVGPEGADVGGGPPPPPIPDADPLSDEDAAYANGMSRKLMKYMADDGSFDSDGAMKYMESLDDDDKGILDRYMKDCDDESTKTMYAKMAGKDIGDSDADGMSSGEPSVDRYRKERNDIAAKYRKERQEHSALKTKYAKLEAEKKAVDEELSDLRTKERYAKRRSELTELQGQGFAFDVDDELSDVEDFNDDQFDRHISHTIPQKYQRVPIEHPNFGVGGNGKPPGANEPKTAKYAKQATEEVMRLRKRGVSVEYKKVLDNLTEHEGKLNEESLGILNGSAR